MDLKKIERVSYINLEKSIKAEIQYCFSCEVEFHYPKNLESFDDLLEEFKSRSKTAKIKDRNKEFLEDTYSNKMILVNLKVVTEKRF